MERGFLAEESPDLITAKERLYAMLALFDNNHDFAKDESSWQKILDAWGITHADIIKIFHLKNGSEDEMKKLFVTGEILSNYNTVAAKLKWSALTPELNGSLKKFLLEQLGDTSILGNQDFYIDETLRNVGAEQFLQNTIPHLLASATNQFVISAEKDGSKRKIDYTQRKIYAELFYQVYNSRDLQTDFAVKSVDSGHKLRFIYDQTSIPVKLLFSKHKSHLDGNLGNFVFALFPDNRFDPGTKPLCNTEKVLSMENGCLFEEKDSDYHQVSFGQFTPPEADHSILVPCYQMEENIIPPFCYIELQSNVECRSYTMNVLGESKEVLFTVNPSDGQDRLGDITSGPSIEFINTFINSKYKTTHGNNILEALKKNIWFNSLKKELKDLLLYSLKRAGDWSQVISAKQSDSVLLTGDRMAGVYAQLKDTPLMFTDRKGLKLGKNNANDDNVASHFRIHTKVPKSIEIPGLNKLEFLRIQTENRIKILQHKLSPLFVFPERYKSMLKVLEDIKKKYSEINLRDGEELFTDIYNLYKNAVDILITILNEITKFCSRTNILDTLYKLEKDISAKEEEEEDETTKTTRIQEVANKLEPLDQQVNTIINIFSHLFSLKSSVETTYLFNIQLVDKSKFNRKLLTKIKGDNIWSQIKNLHSIFSSLGDFFQSIQLISGFNDLITPIITINPSSIKPSKRSLSKTLKTFSDDTEILENLGQKFSDGICVPIINLLHMIIPDKEAELNKIVFLRSSEEKSDEEEGAYLNLLGRIKDFFTEINKFLEETQRGGAVDETVNKHQDAITRLQKYRNGVPLNDRTQVIKQQVSEVDHRKTPLFTAIQQSLESSLAFFSEIPAIAITRFASFGRYVKIHQKAKFDLQDLPDFEEEDEIQKLFELATCPMHQTIFEFQKYKKSFRYIILSFFYGLYRENTLKSHTEEIKKFLNKLCGFNFSRVRGFFSYSQDKYGSVYDKATYNQNTPGDVFDLKGPYIQLHDGEPAITTHLNSFLQMICLEDNQFIRSNHDNLVEGMLASLNDIISNPLFGTKLPFEYDSYSKEPHTFSLVYPTQIYVKLINGGIRTGWSENQISSFSYEASSDSDESSGSGESSDSDDSSGSGASPKKHSGGSFYSNIKYQKSGILEPGTVSIQTKYPCEIFQKKLSNLDALDTTEYVVDFSNRTGDFNLVPTKSDVEDCYFRVKYPEDDTLPLSPPEGDTFPVSDSYAQLYKSYFILESSYLDAFMKLVDKYSSTTQQGGMNHSVSQTISDDINKTKVIQYSETLEKMVFVLYQLICFLDPIKSESSTHSSQFYQNFFNMMFQFMESTKCKDKSKCERPLRYDTLSVDDRVFYYLKFTYFVLMKIKQFVKTVDPTYQAILIETLIHPTYFLKTHPNSTPITNLIKNVSRLQQMSTIVENAFSQFVEENLSDLKITNENIGSVFSTELIPDNSMSPVTSEKIRAHVPKTMPPSIPVATGGAKPLNTTKNQDIYLNLVIFLKTVRQPLLDSLYFSNQCFESMDTIEAFELKEFNNKIEENLIKHHQAINNSQNLSPEHKNSLMKRLRHFWKTLHLTSKTSPSKQPQSDGSSSLSNFFYQQGGLELQDKYRYLRRLMRSFK